MKILIIGGSGFLSGTIARAALAFGHEVSAVTRGQRPLPPGVTPLVADRHDAAAFRVAVEGAGGSGAGETGAPPDGGEAWDLVVDAIPFTPDDARQDVALFSGRTRRLLFVSTDFVYDPARRRFPQREDDADYLTEGYGGNKRAAEEILLAAGTRELPWIVVRPGHIYGPGSQLGCLPPVGRDPELVSRLRDATPVDLIGGGHFLQQPIFAPDLARVILELGEAEPDRCVGRILNVAGPDVVESVEYYRIIAEHLGAPLAVNEVPVDAYAREHPEKASFICHRLYDLSRLRETGVRLPDTSLRAGLGEHVASLLG